MSPYLIVSNERFTKHYYAGTQRIASKVGSGDFYNVYGVNGFHLTAGDKDYKERLEQIEEGVKEYYNANGIPPGKPTMKGSNADPYVADVALPNVELGDYSVPTDWPTNVKFNEPGDVPGPVVQFEDDDQGDFKAGYGFESDNLYEGDWFFFHTGHSSSISNLNCGECVPVCVPENHLANLWLLSIPPVMRIRSSSAARSWMTSRDSTTTVHEVEIRFRHCGMGWTRCGRSILTSALITIVRGIR